VPSNEIVHRGRTYLQPGAQLLVPVWDHILRLFTVACQRRTNADFSVAARDMIEFPGRCRPAARWRRGRCRRLRSLRDGSDERYKAVSMWH
jgi:hypothetical protein